MSSKLRIALGFALLLSLVFAIPVFAGGWAVITLDELPTNIGTGEPLTIRFTVRQHGVTPMDGLDPTVTARLANGEQFVVHAESGDKPGQYTATFTFPKEGNWEWSIQAFTMDQKMPDLSVTASKVTAVNGPVSNIESTSASLSPLLLFRIVVFGLALIGLVFAFQRKSRLTGGLAALCLAAGVGTFMMGASPREVEAQTHSENASELSAETSPAQAEWGRQLFIAKGCITCHYNERAANRGEYLTIEMGAPDLSNYASAPEILFIRLKDPAAAKSDTKMPNLELKETEIEALIAFINSK